MLSTQPKIYLYKKCLQIKFNLVECYVKNVILLKLNSLHFIPTLEISKAWIFIMDGHQMHTM